MTIEEAIKVMFYVKNHFWNDTEVYTALDMAIEALKAQKTGKWLQAEEIPTEYAVCTNCKGHGEFYMNYCWHCGARMESEE